MKYSDDKYCYILSTGRNIKANKGFIGINEELDLSKGFDGGFIMPGDDWMDAEHRLTKDECVEIAGHMIAQWQKFRDKYSA